ncbi:MAG: diguanylate cyclase domain-containing protein [Acetivibrio ethanolgignens]
MKYIKTFLAETVIIIIIVLGRLFQEQGLERFEENILNYGKDWVIELDGVKTFYQELPFEIDNPNSSSVILRKRLSKDSMPGECVNFFTAHQNVRLYVDGSLVYSFAVPEGYYSKSPGKNWIFFELKEEYAGKELSIVLAPAYKSKSTQLPEIFYGSKGEMLIRIMKNAAMPMLLSVLSFLAGLAIVLISLFLRKKLHTSVGLLWLGLFTLFYSMWSGLVANIMPVFWGNALFFSQISFVVFQLMFIPIVMFVRYIYTSGDKGTYVMDGLCLSAMLVALLSAILQVLGLKDFKETLFLTHLLCVIGVLWGAYLTIRTLIKKRTALGKNTRYHILGISILLGTSVQDFWRYYNGSRDVAYFTRTGVMIYLLILVAVVLKSSVRLTKIEDEVDTIKEIAYQDFLTKLGNRSAYEAEISKQEKRYWKSIAIVAFDLNNLKHFNDIYGHSRGDYYIIICSEVLQDIFGRKGAVFRIGGDEFCAILKNVSEKEYQNMKREMEERVESLSDKFFEGKMSIASGYAQFKEEVDENLMNTAKRADEQMYACKEKMKKKQHSVAK